MTRTVDALISAARQEAGLDRTTSDARDAVREATAALQDEAEAAGIEVRLTVPSTPVTVAIDEKLVERIVQPVLDNALRYGRSSISVELARNDAWAVITIVDDGMGVGEDERDHVFDPGARGAAAAAVPGGAGLGLALAQRLAGSAGGEIAATASDAGGRFSVRLPLA